jgi:hypothetical protein
MDLNHKFYHDAFLGESASTGWEWHFTLSTTHKLCLRL